jgi:hypothetical protein
VSGRAARDGVVDRWEEQQWFFALMEEISSDLPACAIRDDKVRTMYMEAVAKILYNFDSLPVASSRPFRTLARLQRDIAALLRGLARNTRQLLGLVCSDGDNDTTASAASGGGSNELVRMKGMLQGLRILE